MPCCISSGSWGQTITSATVITEQPIIILLLFISGWVRDERQWRLWWCHQTGWLILWAACQDFKESAVFCLCSPGWERAWCPHSDLRDSCEPACREVWRSARRRRHPCRQWSELTGCQTQRGRHHFVPAGNPSVHAHTNPISVLVFWMCSLCPPSAGTDWVRGGVRGSRAGQRWWKRGVWRWQRPPLPPLPGGAGSQ